jgi:hypothetical protein
VVLSKPVGLALRLADDELGALERHSAGDMPASLWQQRKNKLVNTTHRAALSSHHTDPAPAMPSMFPRLRRVPRPLQMRQSQRSPNPDSGAATRAPKPNVPLLRQSPRRGGGGHVTPIRQHNTRKPGAPSSPQLCTPPTLSRLYPSSLLLLAVASCPHVPLPITKKAHSTPLFLSFFFLLLIQINGNAMGWREGGARTASVAHTAAFKRRSHSRVPRNYARGVSGKILTLRRAWSNAAGAWLAAQSFVCMIFCGVSLHPRKGQTGPVQIARKTDGTGHNSTRPIWEPTMKILGGPDHQRHSPLPSFLWREREGHWSYHGGFAFFGC